MRMRFCISLLVLGVCSLACSSNSSKKTTQTNPQSTSTDTNTNTGTDAGESDAGNNDNCPAWSAAKLMPLVGPFFYGTDSRPCRVRNAVQNTNIYIAYNGDQVASMTAVSSNDQTTYSYNGDGVIVKATRTQASGTSVTTYEYTSESLTQTTETGGVTSTTLYRLDAQGYPTVATVNPPLEGQPVRFVHEYENCRLVRRVAYNADGSVNNDVSAEYFYDDSGRIYERDAPKDDQIYGYLDADDNCVMPS